MTDHLMQKITAWATDVAAHAARLPSQEARAAFLAERHQELTAIAREQGLSESDAAFLADSCIEGAARIMNELLALGMTTPEGRA